MDNVIKIPQAMPLTRPAAPEAQKRAPKSSSVAGGDTAAPGATVARANIILDALKMPLGVQFEIGESGKVKVTVYDSKSGQVIRQLPFKVLDDTMDQVKDMIGKKLDLRI